MLRHSGMPIREVQQYIGWKSDSMVERYSADDFGVVGVDVLSYAGNRADVVASRLASS